MITFTVAYLSTLYTSLAAAGIKKTLTLIFPTGTSLTLTIVQYDTLVILPTSYVFNPAADIYIPIIYQGLARPATIGAVLADGTYIFAKCLSYPSYRPWWEYYSDNDQKRYSIPVNSRTWDCLMNKSCRATCDNKVIFHVKMGAFHSDVPPTNDPAI